MHKSATQRPVTQGVVVCLLTMKLPTQQFVLLLCHHSPFYFYLQSDREWAICSTNGIPLFQAAVDCSLLARLQLYRCARAAEQLSRTDD